MARIISFEGREVEVPDDATEQEVAQILNVPLQMDIAPKKKGFEFSDILAPIAAPLEVGAQMVTGTAAQAIGGLAGILGGGTVDDRSERILSIQEGMTYEPKTELGKGLSQAVAYPFQKAMEATKQAGGFIGEKVGGEQGRIAGEAIGEQVIPVAATVAPLKPVMQGKLSAPSAAKMSAKIEEMQQAAPKIEVAKAGSDLGLVFDPNEINPTLKNRLAVGYAGDQRLDMLAAKKNAQASQAALKKEIGIASDEALNRANIDAYIKKFGKAYDDVRDVGDLSPNAPLAAKLRGMVVEDIPGAEAATRTANRVLSSVAEKIEAGTLTGDRAVSLIKYYRENAHKMEKSPSFDEATQAKASSYMDVASALEDLIEANIADQSVLSNFRKARTDIAKAYTIREIANPVTGLPNIGKLASSKYADAPLTGNLKTLRDVAVAFPESSAAINKYSEFVSTLPRTGTGGSAGAAIGSLAGNTALGSVVGAVTGVLGGKALRGKILSPEYQRANLLPEYARYINEGRIQSLLTQSKAKPSAVPPAPSSAVVPYVSRGEVNPEVPYQPNWVPSKGYGPVVSERQPQTSGLLGVDDDFARMARQREAFTREQTRQTAREGEVMPRDPNWQPYRPPMLEDIRNLDVPSGPAGIRNQFAEQRRLVDAEAVRIRAELAKAESDYAAWVKESTERVAKARKAALNERVNNPRVMSDAEKRMDKLMKRDAAARMQLQQRIRDMKDQEAQLIQIQNILESQRAGTTPFVGQGPKTRAARRGMLSGEE